MHLFKCYGLFFLSFLWLTSINAGSQIIPLNWQPENEINFYTYPALPHKVQGFAQDKYGYMWIGSTDGLYRFDGVTYKRFVHNDNDSNSIGANDCRPFLVDSHGMLWAFTSNGLCLLNTSTYQFRNFNFSDSMFNAMISGVVEDSENNIWLSSMGRKNLTRYERTKNKFTVYSVPDSLYVIGMRTFGLSYNPDGKIYVAADGGIMIFNPKTGNYEKRIPRKYPGHGDTLLYWGTQCVFSDKDGTIYAGDWNNQPGKLSISTYNKKLSYGITAFINVDAKQSSTVRIIEKSDDELWIATNNGLLIYNKKTKQCKPCMHIPDDPFSFPADPNSEIGSIFKDRSGCFWINSGNNIVKADLLDNFVKKYDLQKILGEVNHSDFNLTSVIKLPEENKLLIGSWIGEGFYELDLKGNEFRKEKVFTNLEQSYCEIQKLLKDHKGKLWAITQHLILEYNSPKGKFIPCKINLSFPQNLYVNFAFTSIIEDSRKHFWLGTSKHGVYDFNPENNSYINYPKEIYNTKYQKPDFMKPCFEDEEGNPPKDGFAGANIWFISFDGTYLFNLKTKIFTRISYNPGDIYYNDGRDLLKDRNGTIWRTTHYGGFQKYNPVTMQFEVVAANIDTRQLRLNDMVEDNRGYIWIGSDEDIYRYEPLHNTFLVPKQFMHIEMGNSIIGFCKEDGTLYTSRGAKLYETNTRQFNGNTNVPRIVFNSFKVLNRDTVFGKNLNDLTDITLPFDKNFIAIEFAALNYSHSENNQYAYKLEGFDKEWVMNGNKNTASFSNLAPGNYLFHVKASNNTGLWNDVGKTLRIVITPAWWQTWWFKVLLVVGVVASLMEIANARTKRKLLLQKTEFEKQQRVLEERTRIASELHDDLGSGLTNISLLSQVAGSIAGIKQQQTLGKITRESSEMVDKMNAIIWAMNIHNDTLPNLVSFIKKHAFEMYEDAPIKLVWDAPEEIQDFSVSGEVRRNIYLVAKEALHNALKYSGGTEIKATIETNDHQLKISVQDNGKGFDVIMMNGKGNGLANMKKRMEEIGGGVEINSVPEKGTTVVLTCQIGNHTKV